MLFSEKKTMYFDPKNNTMLKAKINDNSDISLPIPGVISDSIRERCRETRLMLRNANLVPRHLPGNIHVGINLECNIMLTVSYTGWADFVTSANTSWKRIFPDAPQHFLEKNQYDVWHFSLLSKQVLVTSNELLTSLFQATTGTVGCTPEYLEWVKKVCTEKKTLGETSPEESRVFFGNPELSGFIASSPAFPAIPASAEPLLGAGTHTMLICCPDPFLQSLPVPNPYGPFNYLNLADSYNECYARALMHHVKNELNTRTFVSLMYGKKTELCKISDDVLLVEEDDFWADSIRISFGFTGALYEYFIPFFLRDKIQDGQFINRARWLELQIMTGSSLNSVPEKKTVLFLSTRPTRRTFNSVYKPPFNLEVLNGVGVNTVEPATFEELPMGTVHRSVVAALTPPRHPEDPHGHHLQHSPGLNLRPHSVPPTIYMCLKDSTGRKVDLSPESVLLMELTSE